MFRVIPAIDLKSGRVVRLRQGRENEITYSAEKPVEIAQRWVEKGAKILHVIDLDGAFGGKLRHEDVIRDIISLGVEIQVGGGIRDFETAERLLEIGAQRIIFGTLAVEKVEKVKEFADSWKDRVMIAIDAKQGKIAIKGWKESTTLTPQQLVEIYEDSEVFFLYTNIDVEGLMRGIERQKLDFLKKLRQPFHVAGGISSLEDIEFVKNLGASGAILGSALYMGKIKFESALRLES